MKNSPDLLLLLRRFMATFIDYSIATFATMGVLYLGLAPTEVSNDQAIWAIVITSIVLVFNFISMFLLEGTKRQATIGKLICKIKVVKKGKLQLTLGESLVRNMVKGFTLQFIVFLLPMLFFTKNQKLLHDFIFNTTVVSAEGDGEKNHPIEKKSDLLDV